MKKSHMIDTLNGYGVHFQEKITEVDDVMINMNGANIAKTFLLEADGVSAGLLQYTKEGNTVGSTTDLIPEASDASRVFGTVIADGKSGDTEFPHGNIKSIATVGEHFVCPSNKGEKIPGVPDGRGAYLAEDHTIRVVVQSDKCMDLPLI